MCQKSFSRWGCLSAAVAVACLSWAQSASAQSLFGSGSTTQSTAGRSPGGGTSPTVSASSASGFSSSFGGSNQIGGAAATTGASALNTSGLGAQTALTGPQLNTQLGAMSATIGQGGFVGASDTAGRFVGNANAGTQSIQATNVGGRGQGGNQFGGRTTSANQQNYNQGYGNQARRTIRPQQKIAFTYPQLPATSIQTNLNTQFQRLQTNRAELQGVQIVMIDREVVLRGAVPSEDDKKLAAILARMEPGVRTVKNELTIASN